MALVIKSIDEATKELTDVYDSYIVPQKIWRNHNNKLYLALRAMAAGMVTIIDSVLPLKHRFNPEYCAPEDLYSTCRMVGTELAEGKSSMLQININNKSNVQKKTLYAGDYSYMSASGMEFVFTIQNDYLFDPNETISVSALSVEKGSYPVTANATIKVTRKDAASIDSFLRFSCEDNIEQLGYFDETEMELRQRLLEKIDRQDNLKELEQKIRNLPDIFECNLIFNASENTSIYDSILLGPRELLINVTGTPTNKIAELVAKEVLYKTCEVNPANVLYYVNDLYLNGKYPVYYRLHGRVKFTLVIKYQFNKKMIKAPQAEAVIKSLFFDLEHPRKHLPTISEGMMYRILNKLTLPGVTILNASIYHDEAKVSYLQIPKTSLPFLEEIVFEAEEYEDA